MITLFLMVLSAGIFSLRRIHDELRLPPDGQFCRKDLSGSVISNSTLRPLINYDACLENSNLSLTHTCPILFSDSKRCGVRGSDQKGKEETPHSFHPSQEPTILITGVYQLLQINGREAVPPPHIITKQYFFF